MILGKVLFSWVGWKYLPNIACDHLLPIVHRLYATAFRRAPPAPGSPLWHTHRKYLYTLVVFGYAFWSFRQAASAIGSNLYEILNIPPTADEAAMKASFRSFAKVWHPDKAGPHAEPYFMEVRTAYEALKNPVTRFAYDRFGPQALKWEKVTTMQDYFMHGMGHSVVYYAVCIAALMFWNKIAPRDLAFWNYLLLVWTFSVELLFIMAPSTSDSTSTTLPSSLYTPPDAPARAGILGLLWPNRVAYQHIAFLKSLSILLSSALYQVVPVLFPSAVEKFEPKQIVQFMAQVTGALQSIDREALSVIHADLHACHGEPTNTPPSKVDFPNLAPCDPAEPVTELIRAEMEAVLLESVLCGQQGEARKVVDAAVAKRRRLADADASTADARPRPQQSSRRAPPRPLELHGSADESKYVRGRSLSL